MNTHNIDKKKVRIVWLKSTFISGAMIYQLECSSRGVGVKEGTTKYTWVLNLE